MTHSWWVVPVRNSDENIVLIVNWLHFVVVLTAVDGGEDEVCQEVEGHEGDQQPVSLGAGKFRLRQIHSIENCNDGQDLRRIPCK